MLCTIFRSEKKDYTYLYLADSTELEDLPDSLRQQFGDATEVMQLDLDKTEKLANADLQQVKSKIADTGYYLQLPPETSLEEQIAQLVNPGQG